MHCKGSKKRAAINASSRPNRRGEWDGQSQGACRCNPVGIHACKSEHICECCGVNPCLHVVRPSGYHEKGILGPVWPARVFRRAALLMHERKANLVSGLLLVHTGALCLPLHTLSAKSGSDPSPHAQGDYKQVANSCLRTFIQTLNVSLKRCVAIHNLV